MISLVGLALFAAHILSIRFEYAIFNAVCGIIVTLFIAAVADQLLPVAWGLYIAGYALGLTAIFLISRAKSYEIFSPVFFLFIFGTLLHFMWTRGGAFIGWDEFSHWGAVIKHIAAVDSIYENNILNFQDYPPAGALFAYFIQLPGGFSESDSLYASALIVVAAACPLCTGATTRTSALIFAAIYLCSFAFGAGLATVLIDFILASVFGATAACYLIASRERVRTAIYICILPLCALVLMKGAGFGLAWIVIVLIIVDLELGRPIGAPRSIQTFFGLTGFLTTATVVPYILWNQVVAHAEYSSRMVNFDLFYPLRLLFGTQASQVDKVIMNAFTTKLIGDDPVIIETAFPVLIITLLVFMGMVARRCEDPVSMQRTVGSISVICLGLALYLYGLLATYLTNMSEYEAVRMASFERYADTYLAALVFMAIALLRTLPRARFALFQDRLILTAAVILLVMKPGPNIKYLIKGAGQSDDVRREVTHRIGNLIDAIPLEAKTYIVWEHSLGLEYWISRYEMLPRQVNIGCWSLGEPSSIDDVWTCRKSVDSWGRELEEYDYVLIGHANESFARTYAPLLKNVSDLEWPALLRVDGRGDMLSLQQIPSPTEARH
jgi:hypothetical protein